MAEQSPRGQARSFLGAAAALLLSFGLAGCQVIPSGDPVRIPPPVEQAPPVADPEPEPPPSTLPDDADRHRVAVLVPTSGPNAALGQSIANAANLALLDTGGERIRITVYDTAPGAGQAAAQALADGNRLILGPLLAEDVRAVAPAARRADVPVIAFSNDVSVAGDGVYVMGVTPVQSVARVVEHARAQGVQRFAALVPDGVYGRRASQAMIDSVERAGGRMVAMQTFDRSPASLRGAIRRLNGQSGYDAVLIADNGRIAIAAAPAIRSGSSAEARILGTELWASDSDIADAESLRGAWFAAPSDTLYNQFGTRYRERYDANPYRMATLGYDAVLLAVRIAGDWRAGDDFPMSALSRNEGFMGLDGAFRFGRDGIAERMLEVRQVGDGSFTTVSPAPRTFD